MKEVPAARFKAECLALMDEVAQTHEPVLVTKRGKPIAKLVPAEPDANDVFGFWKDKLQVNGDTVVPVFDEEDWDMLK